MEVNPGFSTLQVHAGTELIDEWGSLVTPINMSTIWRYRSINQRSQNPTRKPLQNAYSQLYLSPKVFKYSEEIKKIFQSDIQEIQNQGLIFTSGQTAVTCVLLTLKIDQVCLTCNQLYGGSYKIMQSVTKCKIQFATIDQLNDAEQLKNILLQNPQIKMIFLETLTNPLTFAPDIQLISIDNTFATPYLCNPFDFGADIVLDSCTKFISGHSDSLMGALCCIDPSIYKNLQKSQLLSGCVAPPLDCYLNLRGIKTLSLRVKQQCKNAIKIAQYLVSHPKISKVYYPGLQDHPQYQIAQKQCKLPGSVMTVNIKGTFEQVDKFVFSLKHFIRGGSLGGVESLISHPATSSHSYMSKEERENVGIFDCSVRISIGIESFKDLKADLEQALNLI